MGLNSSGLSAFMAIVVVKCHFIVKRSRASYIHKRLSHHKASRQQQQQQHQHELHEDKTSHMPNFDSLINFYYYFSLLFNIYYALKHLAISLLDLELLRNFRYLDCYLIGRFAIDIRVVGMENMFVCLNSGFQVIWALMLHFRPLNFRLPFAEFLMHNEREVSYWQRHRLEKRATSLLNEAHASQLVVVPKRGGDFCAEFGQRFGDNINNLAVDHYSSLFDYYNPPNRLSAPKQSTLMARLASSGRKQQAKSWAPEAGCLMDELAEQPEERFKLRPNRALECWRKMTLICTAFSLLAITVSLSAHLTVQWFALPVVLFKSGYELSHANCARHIVEQRALTNGSVDLWIDHKLMFDDSLPPAQHYNSPRRPLELISLLDNHHQLVDFNWYHSLRIVVSLLEMSLFYTEMHAGFTCKAIISLMMTTDICYYCSAIRRKLAGLICDQRNLLELKSGPLDATHNSRRAQMRQLERRIATNQQEVQSMIMDLFELIQSYNRYASIQTGHLIFLWLTYSALVSGWMFLPAEDLPKAEWYILHGFATLYLLLLMFPFACARHESIRLHHLMSIAMALDEDIGGGKRIWLALMRFYKPVPMYCFTLRRDLEMDMLFALKLLAWLFTALSVVSSFFWFKVPPAHQVREKLND